VPVVSYQRFFSISIYREEYFCLKLICEGIIITFDHGLSYVDISFFIVRTFIVTGASFTI
jgi:hypothetical protein